MSGLTRSDDEIIRDTVRSDKLAMEKHIRTRKKYTSLVLFLNCRFTRVNSSHKMLHK